MTALRIPEEISARIRATAGNRCGYCLTYQRYAMQVLEIEHIIPKAKGGTNDEDNLWLACRLCNNAKGTKTHGVDPLTGRRVKLFNPRGQQWQRHFFWSDDGTRVNGRTACGRATVGGLNLNNEIALVVRRNWVSAGWHPPTI
ncbi:MAG: HNH endonuclease [Deltaproteobacteria bacterium]|nr:HNH endonuclease [Deltaproteobacteria bacterium]